VQHIPGGGCTYLCQLVDVDIYRPMKKRWWNNGKIGCLM
jgi:hypothetical protein